MAFRSRARWPWYALAICLLEMPSLVSFRQVSGSSMKPTLNPDTSTTRDYVLVDKTPVTIWNYGTIKRGDIVSIRSIEDPKQVIVKRVVGLPGDKIIKRKSKSSEEILIPEGRMWVEGDESFRSRDSQSYGVVPLGCIQGRVTAIIWPLNRIGFLTHTKRDLTSPVRNR
ncbi:LexA/Signal peptidase [Serendipita vermifera]|nr:LexA/Signal peptidase [Serendipita vermifera]